MTNTVDIHVEMQQKNTQHMFLVRRLEGKASTISISLEGKTSMISIIPISIISI